MSLFKYECNQCAHEYEYELPEDESRDCPECGTVNESYDMIRTHVQYVVHSQSTQSGGGIPSPIPTEQNDAWAMLTGLREALREQTVSFIKVGAYLYFMRKDMAYKKVGYESMNHLFREENMSRSSANNYLRVYENFKEYLDELGDQIPPDAHRRFIDILHAKTRIPKESIPKLVEDACHLPYDDFTDELRRAKGLPVQVECSHMNQELWVRCKDCQKWLKPVDKTQSE